MKITTIIPTYRRPKDLARCLEALKQQTRPVDELVIVVRDTDVESWLLLETFKHSPLPLHTVKVTVPGVVEAMNIGLEAASGEILAFTDDDAAPHPDWLERIEAYFLSDKRIGGVGGRDWLYCGTELQELGERRVVGQVQWFGRVIGNHHLGVGTPRKVDVLKGVNMSFRRSAIKPIRFDKRMRGTGAQVHFELAFTLALKRAGWEIIYDPMIGVDHYPAQRFDEDRRNQFNKIALMNEVHNETLALLEHLPLPGRIVFIIWAVLIGTSKKRGFLQWLRFLPKEGIFTGHQWLASMQGRWQGWMTWKKGHHLSASIISENKKF
jgi:glycosyltransferase involved in cell wall biosynthesis